MTIIFDQNEENPIEWEIGRDLLHLTKNINRRSLAHNAERGIMEMIRNLIFIIEVGFALGIS